MSVTEIQQPKILAQSVAKVRYSGARACARMTACLALTAVLSAPMATRARTAVFGPTQEAPIEQSVQQDPDSAQDAQDRAQEDRDRAQEKRDREQEAKDREQEK